MTKTINDHVKNLQGTWSLVEYRALSEDNSVTIYPMGENARGFIIYTEAGIMSAHLMQPGAPLHADPSAPHDGPDQEFAESMRHSLSYSGFYNVQPLDESQDRFLVNHHVEVALFPNWVGHVQGRIAHFEGDKLVLETEKKLRIKGELYTSVLTWERTPAKQVYK